MRGGAQSLVIAELTVAYGDMVVLDDLSLHVAAGTRRIILGPNGAGKSTLFSAIAGTVRAKSGLTRIGADDITHLPPYRRARRFIARSFQVPKLVRELTVGEHLELAGNTRPAELLGVTTLGARRVTQLTHAQRKLLEIATAFAVEAPVVLLDEPTSGLGIEDKELVATALEELADHFTMLIIEHDYEFIARLDVPVLLISGGRIEMEGAAGDVRAFAQSHGIYF